MKTFTKRILLFSSIIAIWFICSRSVNPLFIPNPGTVFNNLVESIKNGQLLTALSYSFLRITIATCISGAIAYPIALLIYNSKIAKDILNPIISVMRYIPVTAFYPLLIMWFGIGKKSFFLQGFLQDGKKTMNIRYNIIFHISNPPYC